MTDLKKFQTAIYCYRITQCVIYLEHDMVQLGDNYGYIYTAKLSDLSSDDRKQIDYFMREFGEYETR